jgi:hypothetical protein
MGKRSPGFDRRERDWYPTPSSAVAPLLPHVPVGSTFVEPCAGDGSLVNALAMAGVLCTFSSDIHPLASGIETMDALSDDLWLAAEAAEYIITNPPWDRPILHAMIPHFSDIRPTWLLFDADWMHTKQSKPFIPRLRKIVSVGRVKWIPDSTMTGKDNCAWHLFAEPSDEPTQFFGRL